jgi:hypothetical protein
MGLLGGAAFLMGGSPAAFAALTAAQFGYSLVCRSPERPIDRRFGALVGGAAGLQLSALLLPPLRAALRLGPPSALSLGSFAVSLGLPWVTSRLSRSLFAGGQS